MISMSIFDKSNDVLHAFVTV